MNDTAYLVKMFKRLTFEQQRAVVGLVELLAKLQWTLSNTDHIDRYTTEELTAELARREDEEP